MARCEAAGAAWKRPEVNVDSRKTHRFIVRAVEGTSWRVHIEDTMNSKDGRMAWISLHVNLQTQHDLDQKHRVSMGKLRSLNWIKDSHGWTFDRYLAAHRTCHTIQFEFHREHRYQDNLQRDKVNLFIEEIRNHRFDAVIISINSLVVNCSNTVFLSTKIMGSQKMQRRG